MRQNATLQTIAVIISGALLGYLVASSQAHPFHQVPASANSDLGNAQTPPQGAASPVTCSGAAGKATLLASSSPAGLVQTGNAQPVAKKPNILVIFGDDIGIPQISAYTQGLMGYKTPNIDRIAQGRHPLHRFLRAK